jgi:hypothetical protein
MLNEVKPGDPIRASNLKPLGKQRKAISGELTICDYCDKAFIFTNFKLSENTQ